MTKAPENEQTDESGADAGDDEATINDPLTRTDVEPPGVPFGGDSEE